MLAGDKAFLLHDTWGFPIDLTLEMAAEQGLSVDEDGFRRLMKEQRDKAKADAQAKKTGHADLGAYRQIADAAGETEFIGYDRTDGESRIVGILVDSVSSPAATEGDEVEIVLDRTRSTPRAAVRSVPGRGIKVDTGAVIEIRDCQKPVPGVYVHKGVVQVGEVTVGAQAQATIDSVAGRPSPPTRPRTSPTRPCATPSVRRPPRPVPRTSPAASASTSVPPRPFRRPS